MVNVLSRSCRGLPDEWILRRDSVVDAELPELRRIDLPEVVLMVPVVPVAVSLFPRGVLIPVRVDEQRCGLLG